MPKKILLFLLTADEEGYTYLKKKKKTKSDGRWKTCDFHVASMLVNSDFKEVYNQRCGSA